MTKHKRIAFSGPGKDGKPIEVEVWIPNGKQITADELRAVCAKMLEELDAPDEAFGFVMDLAQQAVDESAQIAETNEEGSDEFPV